MEGRLSGRTALVTGAGRGIGRAVALAYAREGANLVLCSRNKEELQEVAGQVRSVARRADVADAGQVARLVAAGLKRFGAIDILVNNAGVLGPRGPAAEASPADWERTIAVNLTGAFLVTREVLRASMLKRMSGCVISVSSGQGRKATAGWGAYAASKFGLEGLTQVFAADYPALRFYTINPGATRTAMRAQACPEETPATLKAPEALAEAFVALALDGCDVPSGRAVYCDRATGRLVVEAAPTIL